MLNVGGSKSSSNAADVLLVYTVFVTKLFFMTFVMKKRISSSIAWCSSVKNDADSFAPSVMHSIVENVVRRN